MRFLKAIDDWLTALFETAANNLRRTEENKWFQGYAAGIDDSRAYYEAEKETPMTCIDQLRRIRATATGACAEILDRAIASLEAEQDADGTSAPASPARPREKRTDPGDELNATE